MSSTFKRNVEDFVCEHCEENVRGDGYTNHCSKCLWSKHVDISPGDRSAKCGGLMEPTGLELKKGEERIVHKCQKCGKIQPNRVSEADSRDTINKL